MIVIFDIDDVCMPWASTVHQKCVEAGLTDLPTHTQWKMYENYVMKDGTPATLEQWLEVVNAQVVPGGLYHQPPYPDVIPAIEELTRRGHEAHFVTARGFMSHAEQIRNWTIDWAVQYFEHTNAQLHFAQDKGRVALEIGATHAIDDRIENVRDTDEVGVTSYLMNQPHNVNDEWPLRTDSVADFVKEILHG